MHRRNFLKLSTLSAGLLASGIALAEAHLAGDVAQVLANSAPTDQ